MKCKYQYKGNWYTEEQLLNHPDFKRESLENNPAAQRMFTLTETDVNTHSQIFFSPDTADAGVFVKFIQFKRSQLAEYNKRLNKIQADKKRRGITTDELVKLNKLERELKLETEGSFELGIKGLRDEIIELEKVADSASVSYYAQKDISRLSKLANSNNIDDINEAQRIIDFYELAGTFEKGKENPFFSEEEIFLEDENGILTTEYKLSDETRAQFKQWKDEAAGFQNIINKRKQEVLVNTVNQDPSVTKTYGRDKKFSYDTLVKSETGLKDTDWISMWTMDITQGIFSNNGLIPQVMFSHLVNSFEKKLTWARSVEERIDKLNPAVQKELKAKGYSLRGAGITGIDAASYEIFKEFTKEGNETGGLIQRFVKEFFDEQSKALNKFSTSFDLAKLNSDYTTRAKAFNKAFEELKKWRRTNTIILDINKIPEIAGDNSANQAYKKSLIGVLGEKGYKEQLERQQGLLNKYESEKQNMIDNLLVLEGKDKFSDLSDKAKNELAYWENNHDPHRGIEDYYSVKGIFFADRKANNFMDYNNFIPRKYVADVTANEDTLVFTDTNRSTGYYNQKFLEIEENPVLSEFYDVIKEVCETIRENMPYELQQKMAVNTIPALMKTSAEMIADKNTGILSSLFLAFKHLVERVRLGFGVVKQSEISYATIDPITGRANYRVNDSFFYTNQRAISERMDIEKAKFLQSFNSNLVEEARVKAIRRFSVLNIDNFNTDSLVLLAEYLNVDISLADIKARNISKITAITGQNVEIGKYIRDFSIHSVVQSQSFDLAKIGKYFADMTMKYAARQEALPILEIMKQHYERIQKPKTNNLGAGIYNANNDTFEKSGIRANGIRQMEDWFDRVVLDNYGVKHTGVHGRATKTETDKEGNIVTRIPFYGRNIYSNEEKEKIKEIDKLLSKEKDEKTKLKLQSIKQEFGKERTATGMLDNLLAWVRTMRLGYNLSSATTNFMEGVTSNMILASQGNFFDPKEIFYGYHVVKGSFIKNLTFGLATTGVARRNRKLMDRFNVVMDSKNELQKSSVKTYASKMSWMNPHELNQRVEYINQSPIMIAMLRTLKIKDKSGNESSVWDAMTNEGHLKDNFKTEENIKNWEELSGEQYLNFKQHLHKAIVLGHGNYDELRGMMIKSATAGKALMMFKTWIPMQFYWRFASEQDDIQSGTVGYKGRYWSYSGGTAALHGAVIGTAAFGPFGSIIGAAIGGFIGHQWGTDSGIGLLRETVDCTKVLLKKVIGMPVNLLRGKQIIGQGDKAFEDWVGKGDFTEQDAANLRANMSDIALQLAWIALILVAKSLFWDDDDEADSPRRQKHNVFVNKLMQLSNQASMYVNPADALKSTFGSIAVVQYIADLGKELGRLNEWMNGRDIIQSGVNAGESGLWNQTTKTFMPGIFKDNLFGFGTQAEKVFEESPFHPYFRSDETLEKESNKRQRAARRNELEVSIPKGPEQEKEIRKILDTELPTPTRLKKLGLTREEFEEQKDGQ